MRGLSLFSNSGLLLPLWFLLLPCRSGGKMVDRFGCRNMFTGNVDRYQVLFILSCVLRLGGVLLLAPRFESDSGSRPGDLIRYILHPFGNRS